MFIVLQGIIGVFLVVLVLWDAFESIVLPRTVTRAFRLTRFFYRFTWPPWAALGRRISDLAARDRFLSFFGPLSLLLLLTFWAIGLIAGFGLFDAAVEPGPHNLLQSETGLYFSGTTFFTLGLGDVKPSSTPARLGAVVEAGIGFGFLALVISYLPVVYAAFSRREVAISRLDVRAGAPPSAGELLRQRGQHIHPPDLDLLLRDFEIWSAEVLEAHLSYPVLCLYRSQHRDQSWLATLTTVLDTCALLIVGIDDINCNQASATFAMARRAAVDQAHLFLLSHGRPQETPGAQSQRLPKEEFARLHEMLCHAGARFAVNDEEVEEKLARLRATYEPAVQSLADYLLMPLPPWMPGKELQGRPASASEQLSVEEGATDVSIV